VIQAPDVEIVDFKNRFDVIFEYNDKIVDIMRRFQGKFNHGPPKRWEFPLHRKKDLVDEIRLSGFTVDDSHFTLGSCIMKQKDERIHR